MIQNTLTESTDENYYYKSNKNKMSISGMFINMQYCTVYAGYYRMTRSVADRAKERIRLKMINSVDR